MKSKVLVFMFTLKAVKKKKKKIPRNFFLFFVNLELSLKKTTALPSVSGWFIRNKSFGVMRSKPKRNII